MTLQEMLAAINRRVDDSVALADAVDWLNEAKDEMATEINAVFPDLSSTNIDGTFAFDSKWHRLPVLFACARFKEKEIDLQEAGNFMMQFRQGLKEFVMRYEIPPIYRDDHITQQFIATQTAPTITITKPTYSPSQGDVKTYINNILNENSVVNEDGTITITDAVINDNITCVWEEHVDLVEPPYHFWGRW